MDQTQKAISETMDVYKKASQFTFTTPSVYALSSQPSQPPTMAPPLPFMMAPPQQPLMGPPPPPPPMALSQQLPITSPQPPLMVPPPPPTPAHASLPLQVEATQKFVSMVEQDKQLGHEWLSKDQVFEAIGNLERSEILAGVYLSMCQSTDEEMRRKWVKDRLLNHDIDM